MIKGVAHAAINATDLERSLRFYRDLLGLPVVEDLTMDNGVRLVHLAVGPSSTIELFGRPGPMGPLPAGQNAGLVHLALTVDDVDAVYARLQAQGVEFHVTPRPGRGQTKRLAFFKDPDGVPVEIVEK